MSSKFVVITGASSGLGLHLAKALYAYGGFSVVLGCRNEANAKRAVDAVLGSAIPLDKLAFSRDVQYLMLDLVSSQSITNFVEEFGRICSRGELSILVNNAGIMKHPYELSSFGVEMHYSANYLGHFALTSMLMDFFSNEGRIIEVTSGYYEKADCVPPFEMLSSPIAHYTPIQYYAISKLACCLHVVALHSNIQQQRKRNVKVVAIRPGFVYGTELGRHTHWLLRWLATPIMWLLAKNLDQGISGMLYCSTCAFDDLQSGRLYYGRDVIDYKSSTVLPSLADALWAQTLRLKPLFMLHERRLNLTFETFDEVEPESSQQQNNLSGQPPMDEPTGENSKKNL